MRSNVCACMCTHTCAHASTHKHTHTHTHTHTHKRMHTRTHTHSKPPPTHVIHKPHTPAGVYIHVQLRTEYIMCCFVDRVGGGGAWRETRVQAGQRAKHNNTNNTQHAIKEPNTGIHRQRKGGGILYKCYSTSATSNNNSKHFYQRHIH